MSPEHDRVVTLVFGRRVCVRLAGPEGASPVVFLTSEFGSRLFDPDPGATEAAGVRLVTVDRPGYGESSPLPLYAMAAAGQIADVVAAAVMEVVSGPYRIVGWSAGGLVAAALAALRPEIVSDLTLVATAAPDEAIGWMSPDQRRGVAAMRAAPDTAWQMLEAAFAPALSSMPDALGWVSRGAIDAALLAVPRVGRSFETMIAEGLRPGVAGAVTDALAGQVNEWDFDPETIRVPTRLVYGADDLLVSAEHGRWWVDQVRGADLTVRPGGHLVIVPAWADILAGDA